MPWWRRASIHHGIFCARPPAVQQAAFAQDPEQPGHNHPDRRGGRNYERGLVPAAMPSHTITAKISERDSAGGRSGCVEAGGGTAAGDPIHSGVGFFLAFVSSR